MEQAIRLAPPRASPGGLREALFLGFLGGFLSSTWLILVDGLVGNPFHTHRALGALLGPWPPGAQLWGGGILLVMSYTLIHYGVFLGLGALIVLLLRLADREPVLLVLFLLLAELAEFAFHGFAAILEEIDILAGSEWLRLGGGNLLAVTGLGWHLWHSQPHARERCSRLFSC